jgi:hypothetical protein
VVDYSVFKQDLLEWKKLTVSTYMHKPFEVIIDHSKVNIYQEKNLISAMCISSYLNLNSKSEISEVDEKNFYLRIVKLPHIKSFFFVNLDTIFKLLDNYNDELVIDDLVDDFREIYLPILDKMKAMEDWNDFIVFKDGKFIIVLYFLILFTEKHKRSKKLLLD